ncbi:NUDIX domain-containing protein [Patescibacteria group bacterium]|nr:NUDIX domain-containing protein [Patescibacteria group bacterium]
MIIQVDEEDNLIGLRAIKDFDKSDLIHRSVHLILMNSKGEMMLQKRAKGKRWYPGLYSYSVSGTVEDEAYFEAMDREMKEEIGLDLMFCRLFKYLHTDKKADNAWRVVYLAQSDEKVKPDKKEIDEVKWVKLKDLKKDLKNNPDAYTKPFAAGMNIFFKEYWKNYK